MIGPGLIVIYALAAARITGVITLDTITEPIREGIVTRLDRHPGTLGAFVAALITCPWCAGTWVAAAVTPVAWTWGDNPAVLLPALVLAVSQIVGMISDVGR